MSDLTNRLAVVDIPGNLTPYALIPGGKGPLEMITRDDHGRLKAMRREMEEDQPELRQVPESQMALDVVRFDLRDAMSELGRLEVELMVSHAGAADENENADSDDNEQSSDASDPAAFVAGLVGKPVMFAWACGTELERTFRYYHGIVSDVSDTGGDMVASRFRLTIVPRVWRLTLAKRSRIFQNKTVPEIVQQVLEDNGLLDGQDFELELSSSYDPRIYCVQYRESDFAFISRLLEEEGIYYHFHHGDEKDVMRIVDSPAAHVTCVPYDAVVVQLPSLDRNNPAVQDTARRVRDALEQEDGEGEHEERLREFRFNQTLRPGKVRLRDYNFENSDKKPVGQAQGLFKDEPEVYEYPGRFTTENRAKTLAQVRQQELDCQAKVGRGGGDYRSLAAGKKFSLVDHPRETYNRAYLCTTVTHIGSCEVVFHPDGFVLSVQGVNYENRFECIPDDVQYRPTRSTAKPVVIGVQTAKVVGPEGEEIHTDKFLRVKVKFHWDLDPGENDESSCWVRVVQPWADKGFGSVILPRIGTEVLVEFLEGDPDQPIIHGAVYNDQHMPPMDLPKQKMQTGIRSNSTPGGGGNNSIVFDDTKGKEGFNVNAQYNMTTTVGNDSTETVTGKKTVTVKGGDSSHFVDAGNRVVIVSNQYYRLSKTVYEEGTESIELKCGGSTITMTPSKITLKSPEIVLDGGGSTVGIDAAMVQAKSGSTIEVKKAGIVADGPDITLQPAKIGLNGTAVTVNGSASVNIGGAAVTCAAQGTNTITGAIVKIN